MALVPGDQDRLDVREVFVERRTPDARVLGDLGHRDRREPMLGDERRGRIQNGVAHLPAVGFDCFIPELRHEGSIRDDASGTLRIDIDTMSRKPVDMNTAVTAREAWSMSPLLRKLALTTHVTFSVGWMGAVAAFLALSIAGRVSQSPEFVRGAYLATNLIGLVVILPMSLGAVLTGLLQGLGTRWGLFKYRWVVTKLLLSLGATILLILHQFTAVASAAKRAVALPLGAAPDGGFGVLQTQLVIDASLAILVLLVTTTLSIYKPWGLTAYGRSRQAGASPSAAAGSPTSGLKMASIVALVFAVLISVHILKGGLGHHGH
jgi:hypothetical protein